MQAWPVRHWRAVLTVVLVLGLLIAAFLVLQPSAAAPTAAVESTSDWLYRIGAPDVVATSDHVDFVFNVALFVPLTFVGSLLLRRMPVWGWTALAFLATVAIEVSQYAIVPGRDASFRDIAANTIGGFLGAVAGRALRTYSSARRGPHTASEEASW